MTTPETAPVEVTQADRDVMSRAGNITTAKVIGGHEIRIYFDDRDDVAALAKELSSRRHRLSAPRQDGLREALALLVQAASKVQRLGASPGAQWPKLSGALVRARAALSDISPLANDTGALREEIARLTDERDEALAGPWPKWASDLLDILREYTGPCREDAEEGVDLPEEMRIWLEGYRDEMERTAALSPDDGEGK